MAKGIFTGIDDKARKAKKLYIGVEGKARKVKKAYIGVDGVARLFYSSGWLLGGEVLSGTSSGQTAAISGYDVYTFNADTGVIAYSGSSSSHSLSTLYSSGKPVYTALSSDKHTLTLKRVTARSESTTPASYKEGSTTSSSSWYSEGAYLSGKGSYTFNSSTGQYSVSGSASEYVEDLYSNKKKIYISGGSSLKWYEVTDVTTSTSTSTYYTEGSISWGSWQYEQEWSGGAGISITGYTDYSFSSSSGYGTSGSYWTHGPYYEGDYANYTVYDVSSDGRTLYVTQMQVNSYEAKARTGTASVSTNTSTTTSTDYKVTTYTKGTTYVAPTTSYSYTVKTYTQTATEE